MYAATVGAKESAQFLAKYESGLCDHAGYSALMLSILCRNDEITELLAEKESQLFLSNGTTPLMMAAASGSSKLSLFLNQVGKTNQNGLTALSISIIQNNHGALNLLLQHEAFCGKVTPLMIAAATGRAEMLKYFINSMQKLIKAQDQSGRTALRWAFDALD